MRQVLKYPGSKWNIAGKLVELIPPHHSYVEAFFGSGAMLFSKAPSDIETINDLDSRCDQPFPVYTKRFRASGQTGNDNAIQP